MSPKNEETPCRHEKRRRPQRQATLVTARPPEPATKRLGVMGFRLQRVKVQGLGFRVNGGRGEIDFRLCGSGFRVLQFGFSG